MSSPSFQSQQLLALKVSLRCKKKKKMQEHFLTDIMITPNQVIFMHAVCQNRSKIKRMSKEELTREEGWVKEQLDKPGG